jgi:hypothetical protein
VPRPGCEGPREDLYEGALALVETGQCRERDPQRLVAGSIAEGEPRRLRESELAGLQMAGVQPASAKWVGLGDLGSSPRKRNLHRPLHQAGRHVAGHPQRDLDLLRPPDDLEPDVWLTQDEPLPPRSQQGVQAHPQQPRLLRIDLRRRKDADPASAFPKAAIAPRKEHAPASDQHDCDPDPERDPRDAVERVLLQGMQRIADDAERIEQEPEHAAELRQTSSCHHPSHPMWTWSWWSCVKVLTPA